VGLEPALYGNGLVRQNVEAKNEWVRAGFKPAPTENVQTPWVYEARAHSPITSAETWFITTSMNKNESQRRFLNNERYRCNIFS
jgi:hypothetical protein